MANQPPRGGAVSCRSAAPTNPGQGSSAPPGLRSLLAQQSFTGHGPNPSPSPAPSTRSQPLSQDDDRADRSPSPEPPSGTKRSRHGSPVSSRALTPTPQTPSRDASMGPLSGDNPLTGDWSSYVDSDDPFLLQKPRTPRELTGGTQPGGGAGDGLRARSTHMVMGGQDPECSHFGHLRRPQQCPGLCLEPQITLRHIEHIAVSPTGPCCSRQHPPITTG